MSDPISQGHYYRKQLGCGSSVIAWSHRSRFSLALELMGPAAGRVLDYGCGDGTFLAMAASRIDEGHGVDISQDEVADCQSRFAEISNLTFSTVADVRSPANDGHYDVVFCMETLEHCPIPRAELVLSDLARLVKPGGRVVISVPIETGPTFLLKLALRNFASWRKLGDYAHYKRSNLRDSLKMIFANKSTAVERSTHIYQGDLAHLHDGFNWRALREHVRGHLDIERTVFSPLGFSRGFLSSQAWFVCRPLVP